MCVYRWRKSRGGKMEGRISKGFWRCGEVLDLDIALRELRVHPMRESSLLDFLPFGQLVLRHPCGK